MELAKEAEPATNSEKFSGFRFCPLFAAWHKDKAAEVNKRTSFVQFGGRAITDDRAERLRAVTYRSQGADLPLPVASDHAKVSPHGLLLTPIA